MNGHLAKPVSLEKILQILNRWLTGDTAGA
jgi:hypothetical protein